MARPRTYSDQQLEIFAYTLYRNLRRWPTIDEFRKTYKCSYERAERAITEAQITASGAVEATLFEALAIYAGFTDCESALLLLETWRKAPDLENMKKPALRAAVAMICPQKYSSRATTEELKQILREAGVKDTPEENLNKRRLQIQELYGDWPIAGKTSNDMSDYFAKWSAQEYASERSRRHIEQTQSWDNGSLERHGRYQAARIAATRYLSKRGAPKHLPFSRREPVTGSWEWGRESDRKYWGEEAWGGVQGKPGSQSKGDQRS